MPVKIFVVQGDKSIGGLESEINKNCRAARRRSSFIAIPRHRSGELRRAIEQVMDRHMDTIEESSYAASPATGGATMTVNESKSLKMGTRVCWRGDAADTGIITETSWDAVTIAWSNGQVASVHHGDMREIHSTSAKPKGV